MWTRWAYDDKYLNLSYLWSASSSLIPRAHFGSMITLNNWEIITETWSYIFRWHSCWWRRPCLSSLFFEVLTTTNGRSSTSFILCLCINHFHCQASESALRVFCTTFSTWNNRQKLNLAQSSRFILMRRFWCSSSRSFLNSLIYLPTVEMKLYQLLWGQIFVFRLPINATSKNWPSWKWFQLYSTLYKTRLPCIES